MGANRPPTAHRPRFGDRAWRTIAASPATAVTVIWLAAAVTAVFAPDMITGSQREHLPIATFTVWVWAAVATGYVLMATRQAGPAVGLVVSVSAVWIFVSIATVSAPVLVTGSDPTEIPVIVFVGPVVAAFTTGFIALHQTTRTDAHAAEG